MPIEFWHCVVVAVTAPASELLVCDLPSYPSYVFPVPEDYFLCRDEGPWWKRSRLLLQLRSNWSFVPIRLCCLYLTLGFTAYYSAAKRFGSVGSQRERLSVCDGSSERNLKPAAAFTTRSVNIVSDSWSGVKQKTCLCYVRTHQMNCWNTDSQIMRKVLNKYFVG